MEIINLKKSQIIGLICIGLCLVTIFLPYAKVDSYWLDESFSLSKVTDELSYFLDAEGSFYLFLLYLPYIIMGIAAYMTIKKNSVASAITGCIALATMFIIWLVIKEESEGVFKLASGVIIFYLSSITYIITSLYPSK